MPVFQGSWVVCVSPLCALDRVASVVFAAIQLKVSATLCVQRVVASLFSIEDTHRFLLVSSRCTLSLSARSFHQCFSPTLLAVPLLCSLCCQHRLILYSAELFPGFSHGTWCVCNVPVLGIRPTVPLYSWLTRCHALGPSGRWG